MVRDAGAFRWSSYAHHAGLVIDPLITDHPLYWALGNTPFARHEAWRALCAEGMAASEAQAISDAETANRRPTPVKKRGRPRLAINSVPN